ncbi:MAG: thiamine pyrophosphate-binding protein [Bacteriovoracaceae bacterium]|nr:thiamine pyrophosphate-binding protein [Bacteriovoracaceae bacterium]
MKASDYIVSYLDQHKIDKVFGYIGGAIAHLVDSIDKNQNIEMVNTVHEQGAGFAAEAYARVTGKTGIMTATSGPGATNLVTSIGSCFFDSVPVLAIPGQVNTYEYKFERPVRQIGFQETDIASIVKPITKYSNLVTDIKNLRFELEKSLYLTQHGRKGPVLLDIPMDIQRTDFNPENEKSFFDSAEYAELSKEIAPSQDEMQKVQELLSQSKRPLVLVGGGVRLADSCEELEVFLKKNDIPVVHSLMGTDAISYDYENNFGLIGSYGNRYGNMALANADLIFVLGSRLDTRQTGTDLKTFAREAKIVHVDVDKHELGAKIECQLHIHSHLLHFIEALGSITCQSINPEWIAKLNLYKEKFPSTVGIDGKVKIYNQIISEISAQCGPDDVICVDVGQHQMWAAQSFGPKGKQRMLFSGGMGAMGFALPAAIGAAIATGQRAVVISGDGGMQMNLQELEIIKRRNLPVKVIVLNNSCLGMVRQFQELYFDENYASTVKDYSVPDFKAITEAYGIDAETVSDQDRESAISNVLKGNKAAVLTVNLTEHFTSVEPKLIVNHPIEDMHPFIDRSELEELMIVKPFKK